MNSQCNGSFAESKRADASGNKRLFIHSLFVLSGFLAEPPYRPKTPTLAHVGRTGTQWSRFTASGIVETWAKPAFLVKKPRFEEIL